MGRWPRILALWGLLWAMPAMGLDAADDGFWQGRAADGSPTLILHYFYSPSCPHCQEAAPFIAALDAELAWLEVRKYSIKDNRDNSRLYFDTAKALGVEALSVPGFIFCREVRIGYDKADTTGADLRRALEACHQSGIPGPAAQGEPGAEGAVASALRIPGIGMVDPAALSLPLLTVVLAGVDAFNPCAFFVLLFLLSLMVHAKSRARMLLVGGTFAMRPDLFAAVVSRVPFVDVVNTMLDESLPLTVGEFEEWGNPKRKDDYVYMRSYSPYDNLKKGAYPSMLVKTSFNDSQVMYWEPAKYVAKLRTLKTDANELLLKTRMEPAGHGGASGRYDRLKDMAFEYAWMLKQVGITK